MTRATRSDTRRNARVRCAIYTRKSSEEGLEQEFNSLQAQREACEAFINSQRHEGWVCLPAVYDDGGFSGATMDRPALQRLLADMAFSQRAQARAEGVIMHRRGFISGIAGLRGISYRAVIMQLRRSGTESSLTLRWRETDSNHRSRNGGHRRVGRHRRYRPPRRHNGQRIPRRCPAGGPFRYRQIGDGLPVAAHRGDRVAEAGQRGASSRSPLRKFAVDRGGRY